MLSKKEPPNLQEPGTVPPMIFFKCGTVPGS